MRAKRLLKDEYPTLFEELSQELNEDLDLDKITFSSGKTVWWTGRQCGHSWSSIVFNRVRKQACPYCSGRRVLAGFNDLSTTHPLIALEWDQELNQGKDITSYTYGSQEKIWWKCAKNHSWEALIKVRAKGNNCPICANRVLLKGYNDLETVEPELSRQWHDKNQKRSNEVIASASEIKYWWQCPKNISHVYKAPLNNRLTKTAQQKDKTRRYSACPYCAGKKVLSGVNDFLTTHPEIAKEWHPTLNDIEPNEITRGSRQRVWWQCSKNPGHSWNTKLSARTLSTRETSGCPHCM